VASIVTGADSCGWQLFYSIAFIHSSGYSFDDMHVFDVIKQVKKTA